MKIFLSNKRNNLFLLPILVLIGLQSCLRMRWRDEKALTVFRHQKVPLVIYDTIIAHRHIHYAISSAHDTLPWLVFIHGSPGSWFHYKRFMLDSDLRQKFQIVSIDRPGFGFSDFGKALHLDEQANLIGPVLQNLNGKPMFLCGHSMGGPLVIKLAADHQIPWKNYDALKTVLQKLN